MHISLALSVECNNSELKEIQIVWVLYSCFLYKGSLWQQGIRKAAVIQRRNNTKPGVIRLSILVRQTVLASHNKAV